MYPNNFEYPIATNIGENPVVGTQVISRNKQDSSWSLFLNGHLSFEKASPVTKTLQYLEKPDGA